MAQTRPTNSSQETRDDPVDYATANKTTAVALQLSSSPPPPPAPKPESRRTRETGAPLLLEPSMVEDFGPSPSELQPSPIAYSAASAIVIPAAVSLSSLPSTGSREHHPSYPHQQHQQQDTPGSNLRQLPVLRSCTFVLLRVLLFPKTFFVKGVAVGRGCLGKVGLLHTPQHRLSQQLHVEHSYHDTNDPHRNTHRRHHLRSYQQPTVSSQLHRDSGSSSRRSRGASDPTSSPSWHHRRWRRSQSPPRYGHHHQRQSSCSNSSSNRNSDNKERSLRNCCSDFLNSYNVQVATICLCLTGEAFAQAVMCPFLYYMVRDFHVGAEKWIGYYAGLLLTGFWGANLVTTLFWGYLSDKYGRKAIMLFGLFVTSLSTVYLGLSTCYHDAMWALVIQGACTGLVPVSKCSIGELANRQQRIHNAMMALTQKRQRLLRRQQQQRRRQQSAEWEHGLDEKTMGLVYWAESETDLTMAVTANAHYDFASKGYSALVVALSLGAALGPLAGGVLTKKMIPGFEAFPYFAPCLVASAVGTFITGVVCLVLDETHPKWAKTSELEKTLENLSRFEQMEEVKEEKRDMSRGRSGYENSRNYKAAQAATKDTGLLTVDSESGDVVTSLSVGGTTTTTTLGTRPRLRQTAGAGTITPPTAVCTCYPHEPATDPVPLPPAYYVSRSSNNGNAHQPSSPPPSKLSPATELYLTLAIYTLLVLTSILGSEFVMLYTQSPTFRGGLEFSAKTLGQILTLRGFLKLGFTLCGYPWIVKRIGLLKCLRLGVIAIGVFSVVGLGWFVPWAIFAQQESTRNRALVISSVDFIGSAGENALAYGNLPAGGRRGGEESEKSPVGMGVIVFCLSLISIGDVLGYVSVLVLFGKSADRMKGAASTALTAGAGRTGCNAPIDSASFLENQARINNNNYNNAEAGSGATGLGAQQGGSGVLWSVAQVSGNVMRLTGPVLAGLLWSLVETSRALSTSTNTDLHHVPPSSDSSSSSASSLENQQNIMYPDSRLSQSASLTNNNINNKEPTLFGKALAMSTSWRYNDPTTTNSIFAGSTSVFYLVGVICFINFIACQYLVSSSSFFFVESSLTSGCSSSERSRSRPMTATKSRGRSGASSSGAGAGEVSLASLSKDEQELQHLEQCQQQVVMIGMEQGDEEERSYSIGQHPQQRHHRRVGVNAPFCALHRPPTMQTV